MRFLQVMDVYETGNLNHDFDMTCKKKRGGSPKKTSDDVSEEADLSEDDSSSSSASKQPVSTGMIKMTDSTFEEEECEDEGEEEEYEKSNSGLEEEKKDESEDDSMSEHPFSAAEDSMSAAEEFIFRCTGSRGVGKSYNCPDCDYVCAAPKDLEKHLVIWRLTHSSFSHSIPTSNVLSAPR